MNPNIANALLEAFMSIFTGPLIPVIMLALMSPSKRPVRTGAGIAAGAIIVVAAFVLILLAIFDYSGDSGSGKFGYLVYLVLGIVFLLLGIKTVIKPPKSGEDEDAAIKKLAKIAEGGLGGLLLVGILGALVNSDQLVVLVGSVHDIAVSGVPNSTQLVVAVVVIVIATFLWWIMPISVGLGGESAKRFLAKLNVWLTKNMRMIEIVVFLVLGVYFLVRGLRGLV
ncbi:MAG: GAP family protein [Anaerolineae bacterium]